MKRLEDFQGKTVGGKPFQLFVVGCLYQKLNRLRNDFTFYLILFAYVIIVCVQTRYQNETIERVNLRLGNREMTYR